MKQIILRAISGFAVLFVANIAEAYTYTVPGSVTSLGGGMYGGGAEGTFSITPVLPDAVLVQDVPSFTFIGCDNVPGASCYFVDRWGVTLDSGPSDMGFYSLLCSGTGTDVSCDTEFSAGAQVSILPGTRSLTAYANVYTSGGFIINSDYLTITDGGSQISGPGLAPLPAAFPLFATGLGALGLLGWRRKRMASAI
jgi:hypothetical protein